MKVPDPFTDFAIFEHPARKDKVMGRASGGLGILVDTKIVKVPVICKSDESFMALNCFMDSTEFLIINVYLRNDNFSDALDEIVNFISDKLNNFDGILVVGGDFNSRIGAENQVEEDLVSNSQFYSSRNAADPLINKQGRELLREFHNLGLVVLNGRSSSDRTGNMTFLCNNGSSTMDYIWTNYEGLLYFLDFTVLHVGHSDHFPVSIKTNIASHHCSGTKRQAMQTVTKLTWDPNKFAKYVNTMAETNSPVDYAGAQVDSLTDSLISSIKTCASRLQMEQQITLKSSTNAKRDKPWYDKDCRVAKKEQKRLHR